MKALTRDTAGQFASPQAVTRIDFFIFSPGVVKDGKELDNPNIRAGICRKAQAIFQNARPVGHAVDPHKRKRVLGQDLLNQRRG